VATIGYLITEAETIWITSSDGRAIPVTRSPTTRRAASDWCRRWAGWTCRRWRGDSDRLKVGDQVVSAAGGGRHHSVETRVVGRQEFAGYWEYVLDDAIFTAPAHPFWGGGGLIGSDGKLDGDRLADPPAGRRQGQRLDMNMVVPIGPLTPIAKDLLSYGRVNRPARPWLGLAPPSRRTRSWSAGWSTTDRRSRPGPRRRPYHRGGRRRDHRPGRALAAGLGVGQRRCRGALRLMRDKNPVALTVRSKDRSSFLKSPKLH
jgi:hypothetical protein